MKTLHITILAAALAAVCGCATSQTATSQETGCGQSAAAQQCLKPLKVGVYADRGPGGIGAIEWFRLVEGIPRKNGKRRISPIFRLITRNRVTRVIP